MADAILKIKKERLLKLLRQAYEIGCGGWYELAEETAEQLVDQCISELPKNSSNQDELKQEYTVKYEGNFANLIETPTVNWNNYNNQETIIPDDIAIAVFLDENKND